MVLPHAALQVRYLTRRASLAAVGCELALGRKGTTQTLLRDITDAQGNVWSKESVIRKYHRRVCTKLILPTRINKNASVVFVMLSPTRLDASVVSFFY
jgi:hypothetical protein